MKYLINFQVEVTLKSGKMNKIRSTFTLVEKEIQDILENDFASIKNWFIEYFYKNDKIAFIELTLNKLIFRKKKNLLRTPEDKITKYF